MEIKKQTKILVGLLMIVQLRHTAAAELENGECCPPGQNLRKNHSNLYFCFDQTTNDTTAIPLTCKYHLFPQNGFGFEVTTAGDLILKVKNLDDSFYKSGQFCLGYKVMKNASFTNRMRVGLMCLFETDEIVDDNLWAYCAAVSAVFYALTAIIYVALPEIRDLQGKSLASFCFALAVTCVLIPVMKLAQYSDMNLCAVRGFFTYFFIVAGFFWTNAIAIQIFLSIRQHHYNNYGNGWKVFLWYSLYAWGCPVLLTVCMAIVNFYPGDHYKPGIGLNHCWFFSKRQQWIYLYSVMTILLMANICIFLYTSILLWKHSFNSTDIKALRYKFMMTIRLIVVMGLPWIFEMISSLYEANIIWVILDIFNALQGLIIFILLVVFRKRVLKALHRRRLLACLTGVVERYLAKGDDDEENVVQHTELPMDDKIPS